MKKKSSVECLKSISMQFFSKLNTFFCLFSFVAFFWRLLHIGHRRGHLLQQQNIFAFLCIVAVTVANSIFPNESVDFCANTRDSC